MESLVFSCYQYREESENNRSLFAGMYSLCGNWTIQQENYHFKYEKMKQCGYRSLVNEFYKMKGVKRLSETANEKCKCFMVKNGIKFQ